MLCKTVISISHYGRILLLVTFNVYSSLVLVVVLFCSVRFIFGLKSTKQLQFVLFKCVFVCVSLCVCK